MLMLVGLGNPGSGYAKNRHNIGFMAADEIVRRHSFSPFRKKLSGEISEGRMGDQKVLILKPMTFMNESGRSVLAAMTFYKIPPKNVIVFHDELDLTNGKVRFKKGGGHAGHNGLRSISGQIGADYGRIRMGIDHPGDKNLVAPYVLKDFAKSDQEWLDKLIPATADYLDLLVAGDEAAYISKIAQAVNPPRPHKPKPEEVGLSAPEVNASKSENVNSEEPKTGLQALAGFFKKSTNTNTNDEQE